MTRSEAKELSMKATNLELRQMFYNAQTQITDWNKRARVNKSCTRGTAFNILSKGFQNPEYILRNIHPLAKQNMVMEFGEYLPTYKKKDTGKKLPKPTHQDPVFIPKF